MKAKSRSSIAIGPFGSRMKSDCYVPTGVPVIRGTNISDTRELVGEMVYITPEKAEEVKSSILFADDLFFPHRGSIGLIGIVPRNGAPQYVQSSSMMKLTCDRTQVEPLYLFYFFRSARGRQELLKNASTVGTPGIGQPLSSLKAIHVPYPPLVQQKAIVAVLGALDEKIELNRRMNATLETMARALFQSWFVDFDPVRARLDGRGLVALGAPSAAHFPDTFQDSELGHIPKSWTVGNVSDLASQYRGAINPGDFPTESFDHFSLPAFDNGRNPKTELGRDIMSNKFIVTPDAVLLSKLNPHIPRIWLPDIHSSRRSVCSTEFMVICSKPDVSREYLFSLFTSSAFASIYGTLVTGTTGSHQRIRPESVLEMKVAVPPLAVIRAFTDIAKPMFAHINRNTEQSRTLASLRDTLLPKLLSGDLVVRQPEAVEND
ncbi:MAG: restriction endonuclease subunit S [Pseudomonadota bacterium]